MPALIALRIVLCWPNLDSHDVHRFKYQEVEWYELDSVLVVTTPPTVCVLGTEHVTLATACSQSGGGCERKKCNKCRYDPHNFLSQISLRKDR